MTQTTKRATSSETASTGQPVAPEARKTVATYGDVQESIAFRAYELYLNRGEKHGQDIDDWLQAEQEITGRLPTRDV